MLSQRLRITPKALTIIQLLYKLKIMAEDRKKLFDQFAPVSPEEWRAKAEVDLKGADFNKKMV